MPTSDLPKKFDSKDELDSFVAKTSHLSCHNEGGNGCTVFDFEAKKDIHYDEKEDGTMEKAGTEELSKRQIGQRKRYGKGGTGHSKKGRKVKNSKGKMGGVNMSVEEIAFPDSFIELKENADIDVESFLEDYDVKSTQACESRVVRFARLGNPSQFSLSDSLSILGESYNSDFLVEAAKKMAEAEEKGDIEEGRKVAREVMRNLPEIKQEAEDEDDEEDDEDGEVEEATVDADAVVDRAKELQGEGKSDRAILQRIEDEFNLSSGEARDILSRSGVDFMGHNENTEFGDGVSLGEGDDYDGGKSAPSMGGTGQPGKDDDNGSADAKGAGEVTGSGEPQGNAEPADSVVDGQGEGGDSDEGDSGNKGTDFGDDGNPSNTDVPGGVSGVETPDDILDDEDFESGEGDSETSDDEIRSEVESILGEAEDEDDDEDEEEEGGDEEGEDDEEEGDEDDDEETEEESVSPVQALQNEFQVSEERAEEALEEAISVIEETDKYGEDDQMEVARTLLV